MKKFENPDILAQRYPWRKKHVSTTILLACLAMYNQIETLGMVWMYVGYHCIIYGFILAIDHKIALATTLELPCSI